MRDLSLGCGVGQTVPLRHGFGSHSGCGHTRYSYETGDLRARPRVQGRWLARSQHPPAEVVAEGRLGHLRPGDCWHRDALRRRAESTHRGDDFGPRVTRSMSSPVTRTRHPPTEPVTRGAATPGTRCSARTRRVNAPR